MRHPGPILLVLAAAAFATAGCGKSKEEQRKETVAGICNGFVPGQTTFLDALNALGGGQLAYGVTQCASNLLAQSSPDVCTYPQGVCQVDFEFFLNDPNSCPVRGGAAACFYYCSLRFNAADLPAYPGPPSNGSKICARFFYDSPVSEF